MRTYTQLRHQAESPFDEIWSAERGSTAFLARGHDPQAVDDGSGGHSMPCTQHLFT